MVEKLQVLVEDLEKTKKLLDSFTRKCKKYDKNLFVYTVSRPHFEVVKINNKKINVEIVEIDLDFESEKLINGEYKVIAKIEKLSPENFIELYDLKNYTYNEFKKCNFACQHCRTNRYRKHIYILENVNTKELIQVGKSCLNDFMNCQDALQKIAFLDAYRQLWKQCNGFIQQETQCGMYFKQSYAVTKKRFLECLLLSIKEYGFIGNKEGNGKNTLNYTLELLCQDYLTDMQKELLNNLDSEINDIMQYYQSIYNVSGGTLNEFMYKLTYIMSQDYIRVKDINIAVYAYKCYLKNQQYQIEKAEKIAKNISEYQGNIGDKLQIDVILKSIKEIEGYYGITYLYSFEDTKGNIFTWFASKNQRIEIEKSYTVKGTVKDHTVFGDNNQTQLTRCKIA